MSEWARANRRRVHELPFARHQSPRSIALIEQEVERPTRQLGRVEQVKAFRILDRELDPEVEGEAVTATRKIKRSLLQRHFGHLIDEMYSDDEEQRIARQLH